MGFETLGQAVGKSPKRLMRMLGAKGNPNARNLLAVIGHLPKAAGVELTVDTRH